jgi:uncharacterized protein YodC (DUF2158 family)
MGNQIFKIGDVVQSKSGGPRMTVTRVGKDVQGVPTVWTMWFEGKQQLKGRFPIETVQRGRIEVRGPKASRW